MDNESEYSRQAIDLVVKGNPYDGEKQKPQHTNKTPSSTNIFLVKFKNAADARAAIRDKQSVELMGRKINLAQFSRQMIR